MRKRNENKWPINERYAVSYQEAADFFSIGTSAARQLAREAGACIKIGRTVRVRLPKMIEYIDNHYEGA